MNWHQEYLALKSQIEEAMREFQDELGLDRGGPNLYPGSATGIAMNVFGAWLEKRFDSLTEK